MQEPDCELALGYRPVLELTAVLPAEQAQGQFMLVPVLP